MQIGNGISQNGSYDSIPWQTATAIFAKIDLDRHNTQKYTNIGVSQILTVPYALVAKNVENVPDALKYTAGEGISISSKNVITNTKPNQNVTLTAGNGIKITGKYPNFTITNTDTASAKKYTAGEGISISSKNVITNEKPDQTITLTAGNGIKITGKYPNFTISNTDTTASSGGQGGGMQTFDSTDILFKGADSLSAICNTALNVDGSRIAWYSGKAAFRAGWTGDDQTHNISHNVWDCQNVGILSAAFGNSNYAKGQASFATGKYNRTDGDNSIVSGFLNKANGSAQNTAIFGENNNVASRNSLCIGHSNILSDTSYNSLALGKENQSSNENTLVGGESNIVSGVNSLAFGFNNSVTSGASAAFGVDNSVSGDRSFAFGTSSVASNYSSFAFGNNARATGSGSFAFGTSAFTGNRAGAFVLSDEHIDTISATTDHSMTMRFSGGYRLFSNTNATIGTQLNANANAWSTISDSTLKENFISADGASFLKKIATMRLGSWNYKGQTPQTLRHYGAMAQEIYSNFGNDGIGTIGDDTSINSADMDGIMMIAIQELIKQNKELKSEIEALKKQIERK
jgi:hypothetical protein